MRLSPLVTKDGRPIVQFGGDTQRCHHQRSLKGYRCSFEWAGDPDSRNRTDACLVIWSETGGDDRGAWVITRRGIMKFCDQHNHPNMHAFVEAAEALPMLGKMQLDFEIHRLVDVVMECVDDLVQMPRTPPAVARELKPEPMWEITRRNLDRKVVDQREV